MDNIEEARVREIRPEGEDLRGEQVVRLRRERKWWPFLLLGLAAIIFIIVLLPGSKEKEGVSLQAAREVVLEKQPAWDKSAVLEVLRNGGFRATPGPPRSPLAVSVTMRRDGLLLRSETDRNWVPRGLLEDRS